MEFEDAHEEYLRRWAQALTTGDTSGVEAFMAPGYHGWFCPSTTESFAYGRADAVDGMRQSIERLAGCVLEYAARSTSRRGNDDAVATYEKRIVRDGALVSSALVVEAWQRHPEHGWLVHRELTEHGAAHTRAADLSP
ncbi:MAG: hypothetical protein ACTHKG_07875 [Nocardioides sp.]